MLFVTKHDIGQKYDRYILKPVLNTILLSHGEGSFLVDEVGKRYLDFVSGFGVSALGYHTEAALRVKDAVTAQMEHIWHNPYYLSYTKAPALLAEKLCAITPGSLQKTFFCNSGSEAVEGAIRVVRKATGRKELVAPQQSFFGRTCGAAALTGLSQDKKGAPLLSGVYHVPAPYCFRCSLGWEYPNCGLACANYLRDVLAYDTSGDVAAFFVEPVLGDVGVIVPPDGYFDKITSICRDNGILLVVDETLTGLGRTGKMFASEYWGLEPDVLIMGKALGGGLSLGGFIVNPQIAETFSTKDFSSSVGGNTLACAGGLATIKAIEEMHICDHVQSVGNYLIEKLKILMGKFPQIGDVRGVGLLIGIELINPSNKKTAPEQASLIKEKLLGKGVIVTVYGDSTLRLTPSLTISKKEIDIFLNILEDSLKEVCL
jgi:4-aminobutyrate aminotransferase/(S)-3-amino-2-methylpropionate transaminase